MEINASLDGGGMTGRSTPCVLSFPASVLLFRGFTNADLLALWLLMFCQKRRAELFCGWCSVVGCFFFLSSTLFHAASLFSFLLFLNTLNPAAKKKRGKKRGVKNQQRDSVRSSSVCEVFFFFLL